MRVTTLHSNKRVISDHNANKEKGHRLTRPIVKCSQNLFLRRIEQNFQFLEETLTTECIPNLNLYASSPVLSTCCAR